MHLNPQYPNILHDMQAAANGRLLRNPLSKRHLIPRNTYPYASERQVKRQQQQLIHREVNKLVANGQVYRDKQGGVHPI